MQLLLEVLVPAALALGCLSWLGLAVVGWLTVRHVPVLERLPVVSPPRWPRLSVVSPARDEAARLEPVAAARLADGYPALQLVLVDDRSTDGTAELVDALAARDPRVVAVHVRELPVGWLGKVWAMEQGLRAADGEWLLFSDADVHFAPGTLARAVGFAEARGLDHLVLLPELWPGPLLLDATVSAFGRMFTAAVRPWAVSDPDSSASIGVGAFNLVRREALARAGGLSRLRLEVADDVALGRNLKASGARTGVANGRGLVGLHWYAGLGEMARGLEKGLFAYAGRCNPARLAAIALGVLGFEAAPWLALAWPAGPLALRLLAAATIALSLLAAAAGERWSGRRPAVALLAPVGGLALAAIMLRAAWCGWRRGGVLWRGTLYPSALLREAMAPEGGPPGGRPA